MIKHIVIASLALSSTMSFAISKNIAETKKFYINPNESFASSYGTSKHQFTSFGKIDFDESVKFLMLNMGADVLFGDFANYTIFDDHFIPDVQTINPNPTGKAWWTYSKRSDHYKKASDLQRICLETVVDSNQPFKVTTPFERLCDVKMENDGKKAIIRGYTCYISLDYRRNFKISHRVREECKDASFLAENNILPQEITGGISYSLSDNDSGSSNYRILGTTKTQITINPGTDFEVYDDYRKDTPNWPAKMVVDSNFAGIAIHKRGDKFIVAPKILADNQCGDFKKEVSICDYIQPLGLEFKLYKLDTNGKKSLVNFWYDGSVLPAQWRGIIPLRGYPVYIEEGSRYQLVADARYPDMYYRLGKEKFSQFLIPTINLTDLNNPDLDVFPTLEGLKELDTMGKYPDLPEIKITRKALKGTVSPFDSAIQELENLVMGSGNWPPYISKICTAEGTCSKSKSTKYKIYMSFTVAKDQSSDSSGRRSRRVNYEGKNLEISRSTDLNIDSADVFEEIKFTREAIRVPRDSEESN